MTTLAVLGALIFGFCLGYILAKYHYMPISRVVSPTKPHPFTIADKARIAIARTSDIPDARVVSPSKQRENDLSAIE